ncbi:MAG: hypothetical protein ABIS20_22555 [Thermoanaerobaculia bacterium]
MSFRAMRSLVRSLSLLTVFTSHPGGGQPGSVAAKLSEETADLAAPVVGGAQLRVDQPYFDPVGRLRWAGAVTPPAPSRDCGGGVEYERLTRMLAPRVDEVRCRQEVPGGSPRLDKFLVGVDAAGKTVWSRRLGFKSGEYTFDESVIGASIEGLVLSDLGVLSPRTGQVLFPPPAHPVPGAPRSAPDYDFASRALFVAADRTFLVFDAEVTLTRRTGGLYRLETATGRRELLLPVAATLLGGSWRIEDIAASPDPQRILLAQRKEARGPGGVSFAVFDLASRRVIFEETFHADHFCKDPRVLVGSEGKIGFAFRDETAGQAVLVSYRWNPARHPAGKQR